MSFILVLQAFLKSTDIIDEWYLAGIFEYFIPFIALFSLAIVFSPSLENATVLSSIFLAVISLLPNVKYPFILNPADSTMHYGCIRETIKQGKAVAVGIYQNQYKSTPGLHILVAVLSIMSNFSVNISIKTFLVVSSATYPLAIYFLVRKLSLPNIISKWTVTTSVLAFSPLTYCFTGNSDHLFYTFFIYLTILYISHSYMKISFKEFILVSIFGFSILFSHDATTFYLTLVMTIIFITLIYWKIIKSDEQYKLELLPLLWIFIYVYWFVHVSDYNFTRLMWFIRNNIHILLGIRHSPPPVIKFYKTFFELSLLDKVKVLAVNYLRDGIMILLSLSGLIIIRRNKMVYAKRYYHVTSILFVANLLVALLTFIVWRRASTRLILYSNPLFPLLCGLSSFSLLREKSFKRVVKALIFFTLISLSTLQVYPYQPLIPRIQTKYGLYYVQDHRLINTIYQRSVAFFLNLYDEYLDIAPDAGIHPTLYGLMDLPKHRLIMEEEPIFSQKIRSPLIVFSPSTRSNPMPNFWKFGIAYHDYFLKSIQTKSILYSNRGWYIFLNRVS